MAGKDLVAELANIPMTRPGFDTFGMSAPILVQLNPDGKWENTKPDTLEEDRLKAVIQYLTQSKALSAAQSYCCQCAAENQTMQGASNNYVPVIMMPVYPADQCPFDMDAEIKKMDQAQEKANLKKKKPGATTQDTDSKKDKDKKKPKKHGFTMQRLTNFDLLSQW